MKELIDAVKKLAEEELKRGNEMYGKHTSRHQAYAVLLEEVEEAESELEGVKAWLQLIWDYVKQDKKDRHMFDQILEKAIFLAAESIQIVAMVQKFKEFEEGNEEQKTIGDKIADDALEFAKAFKEWLKEPNVIVYEEKEK